MTATAVELFDDRTETFATLSASDASASVRWFVDGATDESDARSTLASTVPTSYQGMSRLSITLTERLDETRWIAVARYGIPDRAVQDTPDPVFSFVTSGGTQHITQSITTVNKYGSYATDLGGAIGFDGENVNGVDITVPVYQFTEMHYFTPATVDDTFKSTLSSITGKVNNATFRGFAAGEVLFLGASGNRRGDDYDDNWEITYEFAVQRNATGLSIGSITGIAKKGWEYLWVQYSDAIDGGNSSLIKKPKAVYIEQVYQTADFSTLGI